MVVLDTDACIRIIRGNPAVIARWRAIEEPVAIARMTVCELRYGAAKSDRPVHHHAKVDLFAEDVPVLELDDAAGRIFGDLKAGLEKAGRRLDDADLLIAATALAHGAALATGNRRHFARVPGLVVEEWR